MDIKCVKSWLIHLGMKDAKYYFSKSKRVQSGIYPKRTHHSNAQNQRVFWLGGRLVFCSSASADTGRSLALSLSLSLSKSPIFHFCSFGICFFWSINDGFSKAYASEGRNPRRQRVSSPILTIYFPSDLSKNFDQKSLLFFSSNLFKNFLTYHKHFKFDEEFDSSLIWFSLDLI